MANTIALNEDAKVKFKVGYESTLLDENTKIYKTKSPGTVYFAIKQDTVDPEKGLVGSIYYDIDDETRIKMTADGYASKDDMNQDITSTYIKKINYYLDPNNTEKPSDYRSATHNMITSTLGNNQPGTWVKLVGADEKYAGLLTAAAQTIGGEKTFAEKAFFNKDTQFKDDVVIDKTLLVNKTLTVIENTLLSTLTTTGNVQIGEADSLTGSLIVEGATTLKSNLIGTTATFKAGNVSNIFDSNGITTNGWFISKGKTGWRNADYGGGWYMSDENWIRSYGSKNIYHNSGILRTDGTFHVGNNGERFLVDANNIILNLDTVLPHTKKIIQYTRGKGESNWVQSLVWYDGNTGPDSGHPAGIGWHNTGGGTSNKGLITLIPHATSVEPWGRTAGLSISENDLRFENRRIVTSTLNALVGGPEKPVYVDASGAVTAFTKTFGANDKLFWVDAGTFKTSTANIGTNKKPVYVKNGQILECDNDIDNNAASASSVYTNVTDQEVYYLAGTKLTTSGNAPLYQDNNVFIAKESGHLLSLKHSIGETNPALALAKSAALYVKGHTYTTGNITLKGHIDYEGTKSTKSMIRFIDNTNDENGNGISIGGGGFVVVGSGESASNLVSTWLKPPGGTEKLYLTSDSDIVLFSNITKDNFEGNLGIQLTGLTLQPLLDKKGSLGATDHRWLNSYFYNNQTDYSYVTTELKVGTYTEIDNDKKSYHFATQGLISNDWLRTRGNTGWYNQTHQGGWYMTNAQWIRNYNKRVFISGAANKTVLSIENNPGSQLVIASTTQDTGAGADVSLELFRGGNASWKIVNSKGILSFLNNYTTKRESTYKSTSLELNYNTGQGAIPYLRVGYGLEEATVDKITYRLGVNGTTFFGGNSIIDGTLRTYDSIVVKENGSNTAERFVQVDNDNNKNSIQLLVSTNRGLYDNTNGIKQWIVGTNSSYGPWTPGTFSIGAASSGITNTYTLYVTGTANISSNFAVGGDTILTGALIVNNASSFNGDVTLGTGKNLTVGGTLTVHKTSTFKDAVTMEKALGVTGKTTLNGGLDVTGATAITGNLSVSGTSTLTGIVTTGTTLNVGENLNVAGDSTLEKSLTVKGATTLTGVTTLNGKTNVNADFTVGKDKKATFGGDADFLKNVAITGTLDVSGKSTLKGGVDITGSLSVSSNLTVGGTTTSTGKITGSGGLNITGATTLTGTLDATGNTSIGGTLTVTNTTTLNSSLTVKGATTLNGALTANKAVSINNTLTVGGTNKTTLGGALSVGGNTTLSGTLSVTKAATFSALVTATRLILTPSVDITGTAKKDAALIIGAVDGNHLEFDDNEIMAKASGTTTASLYLNSDGGAVYAEGSRVVKGSGVGNSNLPIYVDSEGNVKPCTFTYAQLLTSATSTADKNLSITVGQTTKAVTDLYARYADKVYVSTASTSTPYYVTGVTNTGTGASSKRLYTDKSIYVSASVLFGAAWNDYAEFRRAETLEPGRVVVEDSLGEMKVATERMQPGASIISDTYGFTIGQTEECQTPIAVAGRVLAYTYEDRDSYPLGAAVCSGPNGTVSLMTREEIREYPERIIGTVSEIPAYEVWGAGNIKVNNRIWIKI